MLRCKRKAAPRIDVVNFAISVFTFQFALARSVLAAALQNAYSGALSIKTTGNNQMTVKSDRWIRRMAEESQLIQPFEATLVREIAGTRIISAGASSYGYDMRLADDGFRVFSPIHGREIDPKHFDDSSLKIGRASCRERV